MSKRPKILEGGRAEGKDLKDFDQDALKEGSEVELEHTTDKDVARHIASDHLAEDPKYYKKLKVMEAKKSMGDFNDIFKSEQPHKYISRTGTKGHYGYKYRVDEKTGRAKPKTDLDSPRIRFNWGYHDAARDYTEGRPRITKESGEHDLKHVSRAYDEHYYHGYNAGLSDSRSKQYQPTSEPAWQRHIEAKKGCDQCDSLKDVSYGPLVKPSIPKKFKKSEYIMDFNDIFKAETKHPGSHGGKFYYDDQGKLRYGEKPHKGLKNAPGSAYGHFHSNTTKMYEHAQQASQATDSKDKAIHHAKAAYHAEAALEAMKHPGMRHEGHKQDLEENLAHHRGEANFLTSQEKEKEKLGSRNLTLQERLALTGGKFTDVHGKPVGDKPVTTMKKPEYEIKDVTPEGYGPESTKKSETSTLNKSYFATPMYEGVWDDFDTTN